jgi:hypothetical protein
MGAVMDRVKQVESQEAESLEDAIGDFAGTADALTDANTPDKPKQRADCVILGYQLDKDGRLSTLVLGTTHLGRLVHAGSVTPQMSESEKAELVRMLAAIQTYKPLVAIESDRTYWVRPKYACRVRYAHKEKGQLIEMEWDKMLGAIQAK